MRLTFRACAPRFARAVHVLKANAREVVLFTVMLTPVLLVSGGSVASPQAMPTAMEQVLDDRSDRGVRTVAMLAAESGDAESDARVTELLAAPLSADAAVEVAYLRSAAVQAALAELHIAGDEQAGSPNNPSGALTRVVPGSRIKVEQQLLDNVLPALAPGSTISIAEVEAAHKRLLVALAIATIGDEVRRSWVEAVASRERLAAIEAIFESTRIAALMSERMVKAGNIAPLDQMRVQVMLAETAVMLGRAKLAVQVSRERLLRGMGIWGKEARVALPDRLPDLPNETLPAADIERLVVQRRFDLAAARFEVEVLAARLGVSDRSSLISPGEVNEPAKLASSFPWLCGINVRKLLIPQYDCSGSLNEPAYAGVCSTRTRCLLVERGVTS